VSQSVNNLLVKASKMTSVTTVSVHDQQGSESAYSDPKTVDLSFIFQRPSCEYYYAGGFGVVSGRLKMRDMNLRHQFARVEMRDQFAGVENAGKVSMESQSVKVSQSSFICVQSYSFSTSLFDK